MIYSQPWSVYEQTYSKKQVLVFLYVNRHLTKHLCTAYPIYHPASTMLSHCWLFVPPLCSLIVALKYHIGQDLFSNVFKMWHCEKIIKFNCVFIFYRYEKIWHNCSRYVTDIEIKIKINVELDHLGDCELIVIFYLWSSSLHIH